MLEKCLMFFIFIFQNHFKKNENMQCNEIDVCVFSKI